MKWNEMKYIIFNKITTNSGNTWKKNTRKLINYLTFMMKKNIKKAKLWRNALDG